MGVKITKEIVESVNKYTRMYPSMTYEEIGRLVGASRASVGNIVNGLYEHLLKEDAEAEKTIKSDIPYDTYRRLVACELAIDELINNAIVSNSGEVCLFVSFRYFDSVIKRYFPEEHANKIKELYGEETENV